MGAKPLKVLSRFASIEFAGIGPQERKKCCICGRKGRAINRAHSKTGGRLRLIALLRDENTEAWRIGPKIEGRGILKWAAVYGCEAGHTNHFDDIENLVAFVRDEPNRNISRPSEHIVHHTGGQSRLYVMTVSHALSLAPSRTPLGYDEADVHGFSV